MADFIQVEPDFISTRIPNKYLAMYYRLIAIVAEKGDNMVEQHTVQCKDKKSDVIDCFNVFDAFLSAKTLNNVKLYETLYKYLEAQIDKKYPDVLTPEYVVPTTELVNLTVPAEYVFIYYTLLIILSKYGESMLLDCKASCEKTNIDIIETFNLFRVALRERDKHHTDIEHKIIKIVKEKIKVLYPNYNYPFSFYGDTNCLLKIFVREVNGVPRFEINPDDLELYNDLFGGNHFPLIFPFVFSN